MNEAFGITKDRIVALEEIIRRAGKIAVLSHMNPDGDAVGSCAAVASFLAEARGKDVTVVLPNAPGAPLDFITQRIPEDKLLFFDKAPEAAGRAIGEADAIIVLDLNRAERLSGAEAAFRSAAAPKVLIDHHLGPEAEAFDLVFSKAEVSSACELIFQTLMEIVGDAKKLPSTCAYALMCGMTTDSNNFANSVFPSTLKMASALLEAGVDRDDIVEKVFKSYRFNRIRLLGHMLDNCLHVTPEGAAWMILTRDIKDRFDYRDGETEGFVNVPLTSKDIRLSLLLTEEDDRFRVSIRSRKGTSAREVAARFFHGGGHENASGGRLMLHEDIARKEDAGAYVEKAVKECLG